MPLSEEELRLLEQMERALAEEDPKFVSTLQGTTIEHAAKMRALAAGVVFAVGVAMLLGGAVAQQIWLGVLGFVVMLGSAVVGLTAWRGRTARPPVHLEDIAGLAEPHSQGQAQERFRLVEGGRSDRRSKRTKRPKGSGHGRSKPPRAPRHGTFMQRMEQRWQQRRDRGGY